MRVFKFVKFEIGSMLVTIECIKVKLVSDSILDIEFKCVSLNGENNDVSEVNSRFSIGTRKSPLDAIAFRVTPDCSVNVSDFRFTSASKGAISSINRFDKLKVVNDPCTTSIPSSEDHPVLLIDSDSKFSNCSKSMSNVLCPSFSYNVSRLTLLRSFSVIFSVFLRTSATASAVCGRLKYSSIDLPTAEILIIGTSKTTKQNANPNFVIFFIMYTS